MRAAVYYSNRKIKIEELPIPQIGPKELLVKIKASGICGSDVMEWYRKDKVPLVLGHEIAGDIVAVGKEVKHYQKGDRISASHHVPCNTCYYCLNGHHTACETLRHTNFDPGGFAEYVRLPAINVDRGVYPLPDEVSYEEATFIEPLACVLRGLKKVNPHPGFSLLIVGSGISGLLYLKLARAMGAGRIIAIDVGDFRLEAAKRFGADVTIQAKEYDPEVLRQVNEGSLADLVVVCTGAKVAINQALSSVERGGSLILFAPTEQGATLSFSLNDFFWRNDRTITTSYAGSPADHIQALELIRASRVEVKDMITHRLSLAEIQLGFKLTAEAKNSIKVIIEPHR